MKKKIVGAFALIATIGGVIYMKNNPKYKEIINTVKTADVRGVYEKIILEKDKLAFTAKAKIKDYAIDYESIRAIGEKIFAKLIVNNDSKLNIETVIATKGNEYTVEEAEYSEELNELLEENNNEKTQD